MIFITLFCLTTLLLPTSSAAPSAYNTRYKLKSPLSEAELDSLHFNSNHNHPSGQQSPTSTSKPETGSVRRSNFHRDLTKETPKKTQAVFVTLEGSTRPSFFCPSCYRRILADQASIVQNVTASFETTVIASTQKLANALFLKLQMPASTSLKSMFLQLGQIQWVAKVYPQETFQASGLEAVAYMGGDAVERDYCVSGKNVRIAILDSGVDYTHANLGGPGTPEAYVKAYGQDANATENTILDDNFPNSIIVDGYDMLGENFDHTEDSTAEDANPDADPIDGVPGHGTAVVDAVLRVAPDAQIIALKVCTTGGMTCPDFALAQALEYALDPNGDGDMDDKVDIINLSLGLSYFSPFHDFISKLLEESFHFGVVPVVAMGNHFNVPFIAGLASIAPSVISVGSTVHPREYDYDMTRGPIMANYSSRGPGLRGQIKPDIVTPSGMSLAAAGTGTGRYVKITGTSFSAPIVTGALALVKEKCGSLCSPFAMKALLMNNAYRDVRYQEGDPQGAPVSLMGAGELRLDKVLGASFWAYSTEDVQASLSLEVINAAATTTIRRTLRITNLSSQNHTLMFSSKFRDVLKEKTGALLVEFPANRQILPGYFETCDTPIYIDVEVLFRIDAAKAPLNYLTSAGEERDDPFITIDKNEFGGHIIISSEEDSSKDISLPFMAILRRASNVTIDASELKYTDSLEELAVGLTNHGAGTAQIDAYQLLSLGADDAEAEFGDLHEQVDMRMMGYRVLTPDDTMTTSERECTYVFEFAFQAWENQDQQWTTIYETQIDVDDDQQVDFFVFNSVVASGYTSSPGEILVFDVANEEVRCSGFHIDHHMFSSTTILRVCSDDLGITEPGDIVMQSRVVASSYTGMSEITDTSTFATRVTFPVAELAAPSYNIGPGATLERISILGTQEMSNGYPPLGLMLVTDAYRSPNNTGAAAPGTETVVVLADFVEQLLTIHEEKTIDILQIPLASELRGPNCSWDISMCARRLRRVRANVVAEEKDDLLIFDGDNFFMSMFQGNMMEEEEPSCPLVTIPRPTVIEIIASPSAAPSFTLAPQPIDDSNVEDIANIDLETAQHNGTNSFAPSEEWLTGYTSSEPSTTALSDSTSSPAPTMLSHNTFQSRSGNEENAWIERRPSKAPEPRIYRCWWLLSVPAFLPMVIL